MKVSASMSVGLLWLIINMTLGIYFEWLFFYEKPTLGNYIFYFFMIASLIWMIRYNYKLWK